MSILLVLIILVLLIVSHEFGHYIFAKLSGVKVDEFGVGYPPRAFLLGKWGGTEYTINWIPFGGFVRLFGDEHADNQRGPGAFVRAAKWKQVCILAAGVTMNLVLGWGLYTIAFHMGVPRVVETDTPGSRLLITEVVSGSPADSAGLRPGDQLLQISDQAKNSVGIASSSEITDFVAAHGGRPLTIIYARNGATTSATAIPANSVIPGQAARPALGIGFALVSDSSLSWVESARTAFSATYSALIRTLDALWGILVGTVHGRPNISQLVGPVGLVSVVGEAAQAGFAQVVALAAFISVNLVIVNLIPIPALDGGRIVVTTIEAVSKKRVSKLAIHLLNAVGITLIIVLMVVVTYHDVLHLVA